MLWFFFQMLLACYRFYNAKMFKKYLAEKNQLAIQKQKHYFIISVLFQAFMWAISSALVVIYAPQPFELISLVMSVGIITAGALSMSTLYSAYMVFFFAMITPQIMIMLYYREHQHIGLLALTFIFIPTIILLSKTIYNGHLANIKANADLEDSVQELHKLSMIDMLTNIYNRRYFFKVSQDLIAIAEREQKKGFTFNDRYRFFQKDK